MSVSEWIFKFNESNKSITFSNGYDRIIERIPRTSNSIEAYHRNNLVKGKRNSFYLIVSELKKEQTLTEYKLLRSHVSVSTEVDMIIDICKKDLYNTDFLKKWVKL